MFGCRIIPALCYCLLLCAVSGASISDWFKWGENRVSENESEINQRVLKDGVPLPEVPFESMSADDRFLQEAQYFGLAPTTQLDTCHHKVIMRLRSSCASLTEEQLSKLSVALLNCQSAAEGRAIYPCTEEMSLRECTGDMDPDTWNTYHLMNNRARAVCLAARQAQFRALTEMTVNKLMHTAQGQLDAMNHLQESQTKLNSITEGTLKTVADGQQSLLFQQEHLKAAQRNAHSFVAHSLRELAREKSLISAGHRELARMAQNIKLKLDLAEKDIQSQNVKHEKQHQQIMTDLKLIHEQASKIWTDIEKSTMNILSQHQVALVHYEQTLENLKAINTSVTYLQDLLEKTRKEIDQRLGWIADTIGGAGGQLDLVITCLIHIGFTLMAMLTCSFINAPLSTRILLLTFEIINILQLLYNGSESAMSIPATIFVIITGTATHKFVNSLNEVYQRRVARAALPPTNVTIQRPPDQLTQNILNIIKLNLINLWTNTKQLFGQTLPETDREPPRNIAREESSSNNSEQEDEGDSGLEDLPHISRMRYTPSIANIQNRSRSGTPSRPGTPRQQCRAKCLNGQACRLPANSANMLCYRHARQESST